MTISISTGALCYKILGLTYVTLSSTLKIGQRTTSIPLYFTLTNVISASVRASDPLHFEVRSQLIFVVFHLQDLVYQSPSVSGNQIVDPPLKRNQHIAIGYGGVGLRKLAVRIRGQCEVGSIKVFLTTKYVDFSRIAQESPFNKSRGMKQHIPTTPSGLLQSAVIPFLARVSRTRGGVDGAQAPRTENYSHGPVVSYSQTLTEREGAC